MEYPKFGDFYFLPVTAFLCVMNNAVHFHAT